MTTAPIFKSKPDNWTYPRPHTDASLRLRKHGPIHPMEEPSFLERILG